jgi:Predicted metal-dependent hydrolases with the TIM-barrel fold
MSIPDLTEFKAWILWTYDPCVEGGWQIQSQWDTREEAEAAAKVFDSFREKNLADMIEHCSKEEGRREPWVRENECYAGSMITPGPVFVLPFTQTKEVQRKG